MLKQKEITAEILKNRLLGIQETEASRTFLELMNFHNSLFKSKIGTDTTMTTYRKYMVTKKRLEEFIPYHYKKKDINLSDLKLEFMANFDLCFHNIEPPYVISMKPENMQRLSLIGERNFVRGTFKRSIIQLRPSIIYEFKI